MSRGAYRYDGSFVAELFDDVGRLIIGERADDHSILARLCELAATNSATVAEYWAATEYGRGIPDSAYKTAPPYLFADREPARTFTTSGTTAVATGSVGYSPLGMELMRLSILENARRHVMRDLDHAAVIRFVPAEQAAPEKVMAYGMELIATIFGEPELSEVVIGPHGVDYDRLAGALKTVIAEGIPAVLLGASHAFVNVCARLAHENVSFELPAGSRVVDAGGFKGLSTTVRVDAMRAALTATFGIATDGFVNLFGMTELASQLYDCVDQPAGPLGERPKGRLPFVRPRVRSADTMRFVVDGTGLLEVIDLCVLDRPPVLLTGDLGIQVEHGVSIVGRVDRAHSRGCSLALDRITGHGLANG
ncbi:MAG: acyl-CoA reductase [Sciscionella sp.]